MSHDFDITTKQLKIADELSSKGNINSNLTINNAVNSAKNTQISQINVSAAYSYLSALTKEQGNVSDSLATTQSKLQRYVATLAQDPERADNANPAPSEKPLFNLVSNIVSKDIKLQDEIANSLTSRIKVVKTDAAIDELKSYVDTLPRIFQESNEPGKVLMKYLCELVVNLTDKENISPATTRMLNRENILAPDGKLTPKGEMVLSNLLNATLEFVQANQPDVIQSLGKNGTLVISPNTKESLVADYIRSAIEDISESTYLDIFKQRNQDEVAFEDETAQQIATRVSNIVTKAAQIAIEGHLIDETKEDSNAPSSAKINLKEGTVNIRNIAQGQEQDLSEIEQEKLQKQNLETQKQAQIEDAYNKVLVSDKENNSNSLVNNVSNENNVTALSSNNNVNLVSNSLDTAVSSEPKQTSLNSQLTQSSNEIINGVALKTLENAIKQADEASNNQSVILSKITTPTNLSNSNNVNNNVNSNVNNFNGVTVDSNEVAELSKEIARNANLSEAQKQINNEEGFDLKQSKNNVQSNLASFVKNDGTNLVNNEDVDLISEFKNFSLPDTPNKQGEALSQEDAEKINEILSSVVERAKKLNLFDDKNSSDNMQPVIKEAVKEVLESQPTISSDKEKVVDNFNTTNANSGASLDLTKDVNSLEPTNKTIDLNTEQIMATVVQKLAENPSQAQTVNAQPQTILNDNSNLNANIESASSKTLNNTNQIPTQTIVDTAKNAMEENAKNAENIKVALDNKNVVLPQNSNESVVALDRENNGLVSKPHVIANTPENIKALEDELLSLEQDKQRIIKEEPFTGFEAENTPVSNNAIKTENNILGTTTNISLQEDVSVVAKNIEPTTLNTLNVVSNIVGNNVAPSEIIATETQSRPTSIDEPILRDEVAAKNSQAILDTVTKALEQDVEISKEQNVINPTNTSNENITTTNKDIQNPNGIRLSDFEAMLDAEEGNPQPISNKPNYVVAEGVTLNSTVVPNSEITANTEQASALNRENSSNAPKNTSILGANEILNTAKNQLENIDNDVNKSTTINTNSPSSSGVEAKSLDDLFFEKDFTKTNNEVLDNKNINKENQSTPINTAKNSNTTNTTNTQNIGVNIDADTDKNITSNQEVSKDDVGGEKKITSDTVSSWLQGIRKNNNANSSVTEQEKSVANLNKNQADVVVKKEPSVLNINLDESKDSELSIKGVTINPHEERQAENTNNLASSNTETPQVQPTFLKRMAGLFGKQAVATTHAEPNFINNTTTLTDASVVSNELNITPQNVDHAINMSMDDMVQSLSRIISNGEVTPEIREMAKSIHQAMTNPLGDLQAVSAWLGLVRAPLSATGPKAMAMQQWALMLLAIRFKQIGKNIDKFTQSKEFNQMLNNAKVKGTDVWPKGMLEQTMQQIERLQVLSASGQELGIPPYIPLPPSYANGREGGVVVEHHKATDGEQEWKLSFFFELANLGPLQVKTSLHANDIKLQFVAEKQEALKKIIETAPVISERLQSYGFNVSKVSPRLGKVFPPTANLTSASSNIMQNRNVKEGLSVKI